MAEPVVIFLDTFYGALAAARSFGRRGIPVVAFDLKGRRIAADSRYVEFLGTPEDVEELLERVVEFAREQPVPPVLFPLSDEDLLFLSRYRQVLSEAVRFHHPDDISFESLVSKRSGMNWLAARGIPVPRSVTLPAAPGDEISVDGFDFPLILKPALHDSWLGHPEVRRLIGARKALLVEDLEALRRHHSALCPFDTLVAQEFVPGTTENLYYYVGYRNRKNRNLGACVGRKIRTLPDGLGTEVLIESVDDPQIRKLGEEILDKLDLPGIAGIDLKFDPRSETYKVIEINYRFGLSDGLPIACGLDLPFLYYRDVQGLDTSAADPVEDGRFWCWFEKDLEWLRTYGERKSVGRTAWVLHRLTHRYTYAVFAADDLKPFFRSSRRFLARILRISR